VTHDDLYDDDDDLDDDDDDLDDDDDADEDEEEQGPRVDPGLTGSWGYSGHRPDSGVREDGSAPTGSHTTTGWGTTAPTHCDLCARPGEVHPIVLRQCTGKLIWFTMTKVSADLCPKCAHTVYRSLQARSAVVGWWGAFAFFYNMFALASNDSELYRYRKLLDAPTRAALPRPWGASAAALCVVVAVIGVGALYDTDREPSGPSPGTSGSTTTRAAIWEVGACVAGTDVLMPVPCSGFHTGRVTSTESSPVYCADAYVDADRPGYVYCVRMRD
jgi:hypothetical protein